MSSFVRQSATAVVPFFFAVSVEGGEVRARELRDVDGPPPAERHPSRLLVRFDGVAVDGVAAGDRLRPTDRIRSRYRMVPGLTAIDVPLGDRDHALAEYGARPDVVYAEPDYVVHTTATPDDPEFSLQWALRNIGQTVNGDPGTTGADLGAAHAWDVWRGSGAMRIAVIDTGIDTSHLDLRANLAVNFLEVPDNGLDDDGNGWIDDVHGYNTIDGSGDVGDANGHGTRIAGIIAGVANNGTGIAGINWQARLVALKFTDQNGAGFISDAIEALDYAVDTGSRLSNNSWGCYGCFSQSLYDAIEASQSIGHIFVASAGNGVFGLGINNDEFPFYPAAYDLENIVSVAATDNNDRKPKFSDFGPISIDVGAPGVNIVSTVPGNEYGLADGTSFATAHVTGAAALLMSRRTELPWREVREWIVSTARSVEALVGRTVSGGIVDAAALAGDCNRNAVLDTDEIASGAADDCDGNDIPDGCEADCNGNQVADACDIREGVSVDCNGDGVPDECEPDCNGNGHADRCDITSGESVDCNANFVPDECEPGSSSDCNANDIPDLCDLHAGVSQDCNENHRPDECDAAGPTSQDCTGNGIPDECERDCNGNGFADSCDIQTGRSADQDGDAVPDECVLGFQLVPVGSTGDFSIEDREIAILEGRQRVALEIRIFGWDPNQDGDPRVRSYQAALEEASFTSGARGSVGLAEVPCVDNDDCLATSACTPSGLCDRDGALNVDESHPEFIFAGLPSISAADPARTLVGGLLFDPEDSVRDPGTSRYLATVLLDVSEDASGTFTIRFHEADMLLTEGDDGSTHIPVPGVLPAIITILPDCNRNGVLDERDIEEGTSTDCDEDGTPDECVQDREDCNKNGLPDSCDIRDGRSADCNENTVPDECIDREADCNENLIPDACDIAVGTSSDCNRNGFPDECSDHELDCNDNGTPDTCDIDEGGSLDCNGNRIPDECEGDCNDNGVPDDCDIRDETSPDRDGNGVPDDCQRILRVPADYPTIQAGIDVAQTGDVVLVADGVYSGPGNFDIDFRGKAITVRSEGGPVACAVDAAGEDVGFSFTRGEGKLTRLEGFTVRRGRVCGILCIASGPMIRDCIIERNGPVAAGVYCVSGAEPTFSGCTIRLNAGNFSGGGILADTSSPTIDGCVIEDNFARDGGGGVFAFLSDMTVMDSIIAGNSAETEGGGILLIGGQPLISNSRISHNFSVTSGTEIGDGGGLYMLRSRATAANCLITGNVAAGRGGGIYLEGGDPLVANCTVTGNRAFHGGGLYQFSGEGDRFACCLSGFCDGRRTRADCEDRGGTFYPGLRCFDVTCGTQSCCLDDDRCENLSPLDCIAADGTPQASGTQCSGTDCAPSVINSIFWRNFASAGANIGGGAIPAAVAHSTVGGGWPGEGNESEEPGFAQQGALGPGGTWEDGDYHLVADAREIDSGTRLGFPSELETDFDGHARILCSEIDRGIYEHGIGDFDCDGAVNLTDFAEWGRCWTNLDGGQYPEGCTAFDFDANGTIDLRDFARFQQVMSHPAG